MDLLPLEIARHLNHCLQYQKIVCLWISGDLVRINLTNSTYSMVRLLFHRHVTIINYKPVKQNLNEEDIPSTLFRT